MVAVIRTGESDAPTALPGAAVSSFVHPMRQRRAAAATKEMLDFIRSLPLGSHAYRAANLPSRLHTTSLRMPSPGPSSCAEMPPGTGGRKGYQSFTERPDRIGGALSDYANIAKLVEV